MLININLDTVFASLADPTRRDIIRRISNKPLSVTEIAEKYSLTLAGISKHLKVLENAKLVIKKRKGKQQIVELSPQAFSAAFNYLKIYENLWNERMDNLERLLKEKDPRLT